MGGTGATTGASPSIGGFTRSSSVGATQSGFAIPLGVVSDFTINQNRQLQQIFELGSKRSYFLTARNLTSLGLSRVFFSGPSLLRMLYAYYPESKIGGGTAGNSLRDVTSCPDSKIEAIKFKNNECGELPNISNKDLPGFDNFFINLASTLFSQPIGLVMYVRDNNNKDIGAVFFEECNIEAHQMGMSQGSVVVGEGVQIRCDRIVPIRVQVSRNIVADPANSPVSQGQMTDLVDSLSSTGGLVDGLSSLGIAIPGVS